MKWLMTFLLGALVGASGLFLWLREIPDDPAPVVVTAPPAPVAAPAPPVDAAAPGTVVQTDLAEADLPLRPSSAQSSATATAPADAVVAQAKLLVPVQGIKAPTLTDTFDQPRGNQRHHEALDIIAPKGTPVLAAADGKVEKLFQSKPGGTTLYQFDPSGKYAYYYAHLDRYADGIKEGMELKRGDVLGYVGVTGNSDPNAPHLHFSVVELTPEKQWWKGTPLNPYPLMAN
ncbi:M23 family metallopeptidase [Telluria aromaticivorans]|uniref:M23 family metallopeptidase n=1 Tax=Telluria aromaticivorans TaxID=2725995 RepID=A0A7Y2JYQ5_9BURK|nr:M23 family metallopeptidase [Telluria aromaticivorans]NNG23462.1 M23 family metallopeptidase [Telluria aromaticivorans]